MKRFIKTSVAILAVALTVCLVSSCSDSDKTTKPIVEEVEPIGTYTMDGKEIDIIKGFWSEDDYYYMLKFSPLNQELGKMTTSFSIGVAKALTGMTLDIINKNHNFDYIFVFEDPTRYYSRYRKLDGGQLYLKYLGNDTFDLQLDTKLIDGTPFKINYQGVLTFSETPLL